MGKVELCASNGSQNNGQNKPKFLDEKSNKNSAETHLWIKKKYSITGACLSQVLKRLSDEKCFAFNI